MITQCVCFIFLLAQLSPRASLPRLLKIICSQSRIDSIEKKEFRKYLHLNWHVRYMMPRWILRNISSIHWKHEDVGYCFLRGLTCLYRRHSTLLTFSKNTNNIHAPSPKKNAWRRFWGSNKKTFLVKSFQPIMNIPNEHSTTRLIKNSINSLGSQMVHQSSFRQTLLSLKLFFVASL